MFIDFETLATLTSVNVEPGIELKPIKRLSCPECGRSFKRKSINAVCVDVCPAHGVWFDKAELSAFSATIEVG